MAFLRTKPNSRFFIAAWYDEHGKRVERSTKLEAKQKFRRKAQRIAEEFEDAAKMRRSSRQVKEVISAMHERLTGEQIPVKTIREYFKLFLERKAGETSASTYNAYKRSISDFVDWLENRADRDLAEITSTDIAQFRNHLKERVAETTITNKMKAIRALFSAAQKEGFCLEDPTANLKLVRKAASSKNADERRAFTEEEIRRVLSHATGEWRSMVLFGIYTGQRLGDLATLRWNVINLAQSTLMIRTRKNSRVVHIKMADALKKHIDGLTHQDHQYVHPTLGTLYEAKGSSTLSNQFNSLLHQCGLRDPVSHRAEKNGRNHARKASHLSFHSLRVTAVSLLHDRGIPEAVVQEWVGHDSVDVHRIYVRLGDDAMKRASNALPSFT